MKRRCRQTRAFTLVELLVVIAIIGVLVALLLPAIQAAREAARRSQCLNNLRQVSIAMLNYESAKKGLPHLAKYWCNYNNTACPDGYPTGGPGGWYDDHGWYIPLMPYIEQQGVAATVDPTRSFSDAVNLAARQAFIPIYACPTDIGLQRNEWTIATWARVRTNYVVNAGNTVYGQHLMGSCPGVFPTCIPFGGAPFVPRKVGKLAAITDGTANTLMLSEVLVLPETPGWGGPYSDAQTALGGQAFTGYYPPNSPLPDALARQGEWWGNAQVGWLEQGLPGVTPGGPPATPGAIPRSSEIDNDARIDSNGIKQQHISARSKHPGGVNASRCDASVGFYTDSIDRFVWNALTSAAGGEAVSSDGL
ncbi:MAG: DUF1559 domain-containing protein [Pirellulales bacterium]|nr:DUF1559 domain-containing protein [Pirellulales bacterium]